MYKAYLVDDEQNVLEQLKRKPTFRECGFEIVGHTIKPEEAASEIKALTPDVVFADLKMPDISGIQLLERIKAEEVPAEFVIVCKFNELSEVRNHFLLHGFEYLIKPVIPGDLKAVLNRLSDKIAHMPPKTVFITPSTELNEILAYLQEYSAMRHTLESVGEKWNINPNTVCNLFSKHLDTTFIAYLTELRMIQADDLLINTTKPIKEVAYVSGYNDYFYFCRVFKDTHNCTPTQFRTANSKSHQKIPKAAKSGGPAR